MRRGAGVRRHRCGDPGTVQSPRPHPPCVDALLEAGVAAVIYALADPHPVAAGGAERLHAAGVAVASGVGADEVAEGPLREWLHKQRTGRPHVTWKFATSIDGRSAAADGSSQWITSEAAGPTSTAAEQRPMRSSSEPGLCSSTTRA